MAGSLDRYLTAQIRSDLSRKMVSVRYLSERFPQAAAYQISATGTDDYRTPEGIRVQPALGFLRGLV